MLRTAAPDCSVPLLLPTCPSPPPAPVRHRLLDEPVDDCEYAASGYFGKCSCASEAIKYKCDTVLGHKICLPSANATLNHTDCAATCT